MLKIYMIEYYSVKSVAQRGTDFYYIYISKIKTDFWRDNKEKFIYFPKVEALNCASFYIIQNTFN